MSKAPLVAQKKGVIWVTATPSWGRGAVSLPSETSVPLSLSLSCAHPQPSLKCLCSPRSAWASDSLTWELALSGWSGIQLCSTSLDAPTSTGLAWRPGWLVSRLYKQNVPKNKWSTFQLTLPYLKCDWTLSRGLRVVVIQKEHFHFTASFSSVSQLNTPCSTKFQRSEYHV